MSVSRASHPRPWSIPREWDGQPAFIIAGGPSALPHISKLKGRRVIAVNSSWTVAPFADFLFFADSRWWTKFGNATQAFPGRIVTVSKQCSDPRVLRVEKDTPPTISHEPHAVTLSRTSLSGAIVLAAKLGARPIILLGADGKVDATGRRHNHDAPYPWPLMPDSYNKQRKELASMVPNLAARGALVLNASPDSAFDMFHPIDLDSFLDGTAVIPTEPLRRALPVAEPKPTPPARPPRAAASRFDRSGEALTRFIAEKPERVLDVGSGLGEYADAMRAAGIKVTTCDIEYASDIRGDFMDPRVIDPTRSPAPFDGVWVSHVLEHQLNVNAFLNKVRLCVRPGGVVGITVPPFKHAIVGGHVSVWNPGLLLYNLILAGFDCSQARVGSYGYNISVLVKRRDAELPRLKYDRGDIESLAPFFPLPVRHGFDGLLPDVGW